MTSSVVMPVLHSGGKKFQNSSSIQSCQKFADLERVNKLNQPRRRRWGGGDNDSCHSDCMK